MSSENAVFDRAYADASSARCAWAVRAASPAELIAKLGLVGSGDRLVAFADDPGSFSRHLGWHGLAFASDPSAGSFSRASLDAPRAADAPDGAACARASYAYASGACPGRLIWYADMLAGAGLRVPELRELGRAARMEGALLVVGNTVPTSACCRPLELGAHVVLEGLAPCGLPGAHAVAVGRSVARRGRHQVADPAAEDAYRMLVRALGEPGADAPASCCVDGAGSARAAAALPRLLGELQPRVDAARAVAEYLSCHPRVGRVCYPGLATHPDRAHAAAVLMHGFGPCLSFAPLGGDRVRAAAAAGAVVRLLSEAFGEDALSARSGELADGVPYVRLRLGSADPLDVVDALDAAIRRVEP